MSNLVKATCCKCQIQFDILAKWYSAPALCYDCAMDKAGY